MFVISNVNEFVIKASIFVEFLFIVEQMSFVFLAWSVSQKSVKFLMLAGLIFNMIKLLTVFQSC